MKKPNRKKKETKSIYSVHTDELIMRDHLAVDRTSLANERTFQAYVRSGLAFGAVGFGLIKLIETTIALVTLGWILIVIGIITLIIGTIRFFQFRKSISALSCQYNIKDKSKILVVEEKENE